MSSDEKKVQELDSLFRKALEHQSLSIKHLERVAHELDEGVTYDDEDGHKMLRLVLQYRLDTIDSIKRLLAMNKALCHAVGIDEHNSMKKNLDVAAYLLGEDSLLRELTFLSGLWRQLNKVLALTEKSLRLQQEEKKQHERILEKIRNRLGKSPEEKPAKVDKKLNAKERELFYSIKDALGYAEYFRLNIEQLTEAYHHYGGIPKFGLIYDYLAGLKGPVSQFQMAIQHGIGLSKVLSDKLGQHLGLSLEKQNVSQLVHQLNKTLDKHITEQKQLQQTRQNQKAYWQQLEQNLEFQRRQAPKPQPSERFDMPCN